MNKKSVHRLFAALLPLLLALPLSAEVPGIIRYQGRLTDAQGNPVTGNRTVAVRVYDAPTGGNMTYEETIGTVSFANGTYSFPFGGKGDGIIAVLNGLSDYLALSVNGTEDTNRARLLAVPYALKVQQSRDTQALRNELVAAGWLAADPGKNANSFVFYGPTGITGVDGGSAGDYIPWNSGQTAVTFRYQSISQTFQNFIDRRLATGDRIIAYKKNLLAELSLPIAERTTFNLNFPAGAGDTNQTSIQAFFAHPVSQGTVEEIIDAGSPNTATMVPVGGSTATTQGMTYKYNGVDYKIYGWWGPASNTTKPTKILKSKPEPGPSSYLFFAPSSPNGAVVDGVFDFVAFSTAAGASSRYGSNSTSGESFATRISRMIAEEKNYRIFEYTFNPLEPSRVNNEAAYYPIKWVNKAGHTATSIQAIFAHPAKYGKIKEIKAANGSTSTMEPVEGFTTDKSTGSHMGREIFINGEMYRLYQWWVEASESAPQINTYISENYPNP